MKCKQLVLLATLVVASIFVPDVIAQQWVGSGRIKGTVVDQDGSPIKGAKVYYELAQDKSIGPEPFTTNKKGKFSKLGIKGGQWFVHGEAEGYHPSKDVVADVYSTGISDPIEIVLTKIPEEELRDLKRYEANSFLKKGDELRAEGKNAEARKEYELALAELNESDYPTVYAGIAGTFLAEGNIADAKIWLEKSLAINPEHVNSLKPMCAIIASEGKVDEAETMLAKIPADQVVDINTLLNIGMSYYNKSEAAKAKPFLDRAVESYPDHAIARYFRGLVNMNMSANADALKDFEKLIELAPESSQAIEVNDLYLEYLRSQVSR